VCDIAIVCHITVVCEMLYSLPVLEAPCLREAAKTGSGKKTLITDEYKGSRIGCGWPPGPHIFVG
jgi:hypothetical protein